MSHEPEAHSNSSVTVSVVSHGHGELVSRLLGDLAACPQVSDVLLTLNIPEPALEGAESGNVHVVRNSDPKGFAANHNAAFARVRTPYFAVVNPDIRLPINPLPVLIGGLQAPGVSVCAPGVVNPQGAREDSARHFPTLPRLVRKAFGGHDGRLDGLLGTQPFMAPWVAGMFMLLRSADFASVGGFDEEFFLYYEDVDLCARMWSRSKAVMCCPAVSVVHDARRASRRSFRHMTWHARSLMRFLVKHPRLPRPTL